MKVLDTNVISELMREAPDVKVLAWVAAQRPLTLAITTITLAEIGRGLQRKPAGKRREGLEQRFVEFIGRGFRGRVLAFDEDAARCYGELAAARERSGLHADAVDLMIVAIAKNAGALVVTRNISDFDGCGIELINPWL